MDREKEFFLKLKNFKITREDVLYSAIIDDCLFWKLTSQGHDFWAKICYEINDIKAIKRKTKNIKFKIK